MLVRIPIGQTDLRQLTNGETGTFVEGIGVLTLADKHLLCVDGKVVRRVVDGLERCEATEVVRTFDECRVFVKDMWIPWVCH